MPKKYGVMEKDLVVAHVVNLVLTGKLRTGDRVDRNQLARELGISRVPIQEAMVQLDHDGIVATRYHRGVFVERFDEETVREHHEIYGLLDGMASERAAADTDGQILPHLQTLMGVMRSTTDSTAFQETAHEYRQTIHHEYAGPRLVALIRTSQSFTPREFWVAYPNSRDELLPFYEDETTAIRDHERANARAANVGRSEYMAKVIVAELAERDVIDDVRYG